MGAKRNVRVLRPPAEPPGDLAELRVWCGRPRTFAEWRALRRWRKLPAWERDVAGYLLRALREDVGLTQKELAARLGVSQQAVHQAERWTANPTVELLRAWAAACGATLEIGLRPSQPRGRRKA